MTGVLQHALRVIAVLGLSLVADPALAGQVSTGPAVTSSQQADRLVVAGSISAPDLGANRRPTPQTANVPIGTILLRVIPHVGAQALNMPIKWRVWTFGRDEAGHRQVVTEVTEPAPEFVLPAGWYVVHAHLPDQVIKHPVEVTAGRTFKYTLVKNHGQ